MTITLLAVRPAAFEIAPARSPSRRGDGEQAAKLDENPFHVIALAVVCGGNGALSLRRHERGL